MSAGTTPPFRADHVGSLLRPAGLKEARVRLLGPDTAESNLGPHGNEELAGVEDGFVRDVIALQNAWACALLPTESSVGVAGSAS